VAATEFEVYPNAPLQLVAMELRYPFSPRLATSDAIAFFHERLGATLPIVEPLAQQMVMLAVGPQDVPSPPAASGPVPTKSLFRMTTRRRTTLVTVSGGNTIIETSDYERYGTFRPFIERVLATLEEFGHPVGVDRVGLRYIDEIRVPSITTSPGDWSPYINPSLLAAKDLGGRAHEELQPDGWQGVLEYRRGERMGLVMRYGALDGMAVNPDGPLSLARRQEPGPFFLIDVDSFWNADEDEMAEFSLNQVLDQIDTLHRPIRDIFEHSITDALRNEVLRGH
jgi:uncharacterized protein (TIGR04255 family)